jgi:hypothetical protein
LIVNYFWILNVTILIGLIIKKDILIVTILIGLIIKKDILIVICAWPTWIIKNYEMQLYNFLVFSCFQLAKQNLFFLNDDRNQFFFHHMFHHYTNVYSVKYTICMMRMILSLQEKYYHIFLINMDNTVCHQCYCLYSICLFFFRIWCNQIMANSHLMTTV